MSQVITQIYQHVLTGSYLFLGVIAILINSIVGLFNVRTPLWNAMPSIDENPRYIFDWQYPQFLVTASSLHARHLDHYRQEMAQGHTLLNIYRWGEDLTLGEELTLGDNLDNAIYIGWWMADTNVSWTEIESPTILFRTDLVDPTTSYNMEMIAASFGPQSASIMLNGEKIATVLFDDLPSSQTIEFDGSMLKQDAVNEITMNLPDARYPGLEDLRKLGVRYAPHRLGLSNVTVRMSPVD